MTNYPGVTFVMPAYNAALYIEKAIDSIIQQTVKEWELIIVDDCSDDDTLQIAQRYARHDGRIRVLSMDSPSGAAYQPRKKAIMSANTEYVAPLDADDWVGPDYLASLLGLGSKWGADIVFPTMYSVTADGIEHRLVPDSGWKLYGQPVLGRECVKYTLDGWEIGCNGGVILKSRYMQAFSCLPDDISYGHADELLTRWLLLKCRTVIFSEAPYYYRQNEMSITHRLSFSRFTLLLNNLSLLELCLKNFGRESCEYQLAQKQNFHGIFDAYRLINDNKLLAEDKRKALKLINQCRRRVDVEMLKSVVSPRYLVLIHRWMPTRICLKIIDKIISLVKSHSEAVK